MQKSSRVAALLLANQSFALTMLWRYRCGELLPVYFFQPSLHIKDEAQLKDTSACLAFCRQFRDWLLTKGGVRRRILSLLFFDSLRQQHSDRQGWLCVSFLLCSRKAEGGLCLNGSAKAYTYCRRLMISVTCAIDG